LGVFDTVAARLREIGGARLDAKIKRLLEESSELDAKFRAEAKRFKIDLKNTASRSYYEVLGIPYTNDRKTIRAAYLEMMKRYHPDVSREKGAKEISEMINEAYSTLKDSSLKQEYDAAYSRGSSKIGAEATREMSESLLRKYMEFRERDFAEFRKRVAVPLERDEIRTAIDEVLDWRGRFSKASGLTFGRITDYGRRLRRLERLNKALVKRGGNGSFGVRLGDNAAELALLVQAYGDIEKGISAVEDSTMKKISIDEARISRELRNAI
jgi:curved DNA-binding protein CbpA